jgi:hypothetical protein
MSVAISELNAHGDLQALCAWRSPSNLNARGESITRG